MKFSLFFDLAMVVSGNGIPDRKATEAMMESVKTNPRAGRYFHKAFKDPLEGIPEEEIVEDLPKDTEDPAEEKPIGDEIPNPTVDMEESSKNEEVDPIETPTPSTEDEDEEYAQESTEEEECKEKDTESHMSDEKSRNQLSRTLESMQKADLIVKRRPINDTSRKNTFYEIASNPLRFYFAYLLEADDYMTVGDRSYFDSRIRPSLVTYVSYRFEEIARSWFSILSQNGKRPDVLRIGTYWYDDKDSRRSGEFDVALQTSEGYEIYECKFLENKAPLSLVQEEKRKAMAAGGLAVTRFGMISSSGFEENTDQAVLITGDDLYASCLKI